MLLFHSIRKKEKKELQIKGGGMNMYTGTLLMRGMNSEKGPAGQWYIYKLLHVLFIKFHACRYLPKSSVKIFQHW